MLSFDGAVTDASFFFDLDKSLKRNHKYFYQIQFQLLLCDFQKCDFIVWTHNWLHILEVERDDIFNANKLLVVENFYMKNMLSELLMRKLEYFENKIFDGEKEKYYCYCESIYNEDETWIGCDSETSKWEWFHLTRVNLKRVPKGNWYYPVCRKKRKSYNKDNENCKKKWVTQANL